MSTSTLLFESDGRPTKPLLDLLTLFEVKHDSTLSGIRDATKAAWNHGEKHRTETLEVYDQKKEAAMPLFGRLGLLDEVKASLTHYLHALVLGADLKNFRKRLAFLRSEWERGVRFENLYLLAREQPYVVCRELLDETNAELPFDTPNAGPNILPRNQAMVIAKVHAQALSRLPWRDVHMKLVIAPMIDGKFADTHNTLHNWNLRSDTGGRCLVVSSQPYVTYHRLIARAALSQRHDVVDCIGNSNSEISITTYLENIARIAYDLAFAEYR